MTVREIMDAIEAERKRQHVTASEMCSKAGFTGAEYSRWKHGRCAPTLTPLIQIANVLGLRVEIVKD